MHYVFATLYMCVCVREREREKPVACLVVHSLALSAVCSAGCLPHRASAKKSRPREQSERAAGLRRSVHAPRAACLPASQLHNIIRERAQPGPVTRQPTMLSLVLRASNCTTSVYNNNVCTLMLRAGTNYKCMQRSKSALAAIYRDRNEIAPLFALINIFHPSRWRCPACAESAGKCVGETHTQRQRRTGRACREQRDACGSFCALRVKCRLEKQTGKIQFQTFSIGRTNIDPNFVPHGKQ
jgi:hypothetical protein